jgi:hypothetical protein
MSLFQEIDSIRESPSAAAKVTFFRRNLFPPAPNCRLNVPGNERFSGANPSSAVRTE